MLKVQKYQTYEQKKEAIYKYRDSHWEKFQSYNTLSKRKYRAFQAQAKILRNILIAFFED
jgi:hypothetical protein